MGDSKIKTFDILNITYSPKSLKIEVDDAIASMAKAKEVLKVKAKMTHAGRLTSNGGLYLPAFMARSIPRWTQPFQRPILVNHDRLKDPIGRVVSARFVKTPPANVDAALVRKFYNIRNLNDEKVWDTIHKNESFFMNPNSTGYGYTETTYFISDYAAMQRVLDNRYLTLSVSYGSDALYCSACNAPFQSGDCDHYIGDIVDGKLVYGVYGNLFPREGSYVTVPADEFAQHFEHEFVTSDCDGNSMMCSFDSYKETILPQMIEDAEVTLIRDGSTINVFMQDINKSGGANMHLTMKKLLADTASNYSELSKFLPEGVKPLTEDELKELDDSQFIGANRTFPVVDLAHAEAIEKLLEKVNDSEAKREFVEIFKETKEQLAAKAARDQAKEMLLSEDTLFELSKDDLKVAYETLTQVMQKRGVKPSTEAEDEDDAETAIAIVKTHNQQLKQQLKVVQDSMQEIINEMTGLYVNMIIDMKKTAEMEIKDEDAYREELKKRTIQSLKDLYHDLHDSLADRLNGAQGGHAPEKDPVKKHNADDKDTRKAIEDHYRFLLNNMGPKEANDYLAMKIRNGEYTVEDNKNEK